MQTFDVGMVFSASKNVQSTVTAGFTENISGSVYTAALRPASHPVYTLYCQTIIQLRSKHIFSSDYPPPVALSLPTQQVQPSVSPQYGQTHLQSSIKFPHFSQRGLSSLAIHLRLLQTIFLFESIINVSEQPLKEKSVKTLFTNLLGSK
jgi:hypothetical protein